MKLITVLTLFSFSVGYAQFGLGVAPGLFIPFANSKVDPVNSFEIDPLLKFNLIHFSFSMRIPVMRKTLSTYEMYTPLDRIEKQVSTHYRIWDPKIEIAWYYYGTLSDQPPFSPIVGINFIPFLQMPVEKTTDRISDSEAFIESRQRSFQLGYGIFLGCTFNPKYALNNKLIFDIRAGYQRYRNIKINNFEFNQFGNAVLKSQTVSVNSLTMNLVVTYYFEQK